MMNKSLILVSVLTTVVTANVCYTGLPIEVTNFISVKCSLINGVSEVKITCKSDAGTLLETPKLKLEFDEIENVEMNSCVFPADGFRVIEFLNSLGINKLSTLKISNPRSPLKREHLSGLSLEAIQFIETRLSNLPNDLLQDVELRKHLTLSGGDLTEIPKGLLESVPSIEWLAISYTNLKKLRRDDFASLGNLTDLLLSYNAIENIEEGIFNGIENVQQVDLSFNRISSLPENFFHSLVNLQHVHLSGNKFTELPANLLKENNKLKSFRMNLIKFYYPGEIKSLPASFFSGLHNLEQIGLTSIGLTSLPVNIFSDLTSLKKLVLEGNELTELPSGIFDNATKLEELNLSMNELISLPENIFSKNKLKELNLYRNKLTNLTEGNLKGLYNLRVLNVAKNSLSYMYENLYNYFNSLEVIDVSDNQLSLSLENAIDSSGESFSIFHKCLHIRKLNAAHNRVTRIFSDLGFQRIKDIDLSNNQITEISIYNIISLHRNVHLNLANNKISVVNFQNVENAKFCNTRNIIINIQENPIQCDCNALDLVRYLQEKMADNAYHCVRINARNLKCASPLEFADRKVIDLGISEIPCSAVNASESAVE